MRNVPVQWRFSNTNKPVICTTCENKIGQYGIRVPLKDQLTEVVICDKCWNNRAEFVEKTIINIRKMNNELSFIQNSFDSNFDLNELVTDALNTWRYQNQLSVLETTKEIIDIRGNIKLRKVPVKWLVTLMEYASYETDPFMQVNWATLLANMINSAHPDNLQSFYTFIQLYSRCGLPEALIMDKLFHYSFTSSENQYGTLKPSSLVTELNQEFSYKDVQIAIQNLFQLNLITYANNEIVNLDTGETTREDDHVCFSLLGAELWKNLKKLL